MENKEELTATVTGNDITPFVAEPTNINPEVQPEPLDEDEQAAMFLNHAHKDFRRVAFALADRKKHSVSRVLEAVLFEPLEEVKLQGKAEEELFDLCKKIMYAKGKVLTYAYNKIQESKKGESDE